MGYLDYLRHGKNIVSKKNAMPVYMVYFITDACNAKCKHCLLADGAHPGWETPTMEFKRKELSLEEIDKVTASMGKSLMFLLPTGGEPFLRLVRAHGGPASFAFGTAILFVELLTAGAGGIYGIATFIAGKKY